MPSSRPAVLPRPTPGTPPRPRLPAAERFTLESGLRVVLAAKHTVPQVVVRLVMPAGSAADPAGRRGTASLVGQLLREGTQHQDAEALNRRIDGLGAAIHASVGHDLVEVEAVLLSDTLEEGVHLLAEMVREPALPPDEVERVRAETLDALEGRDDEPGNVADDRLAREVFGEGHPYGTPSFGDRAGIAAVTRDELAAFHAAHFRPGGAFLVAAGDFHPDAMRALLERAFAGWRGAAPAVTYPAAAAVPPAVGRTLALPWEDAAQAEIRVGGRGLARTGPEWTAGAVANYVLGGSAILGRLGANLREDKGWTYGAYSAFAAGRDLGGWGAHAAVDAAVAADALAEMLGEMRRMAEEPVPEEELRRARDALVLSLPRAFETPGQIASRLSTLEVYGLPRDYWERYAAAVQAVTADDVRRVAARCFHPERVVRVVVGGAL